MIAYCSQVNVNCLTAEAGNGRHGVLRKVRLCDEFGKPILHLPLGGTFRLQIEIETDSAIENPTIGVGLDSTLAGRALTVHTPLSADTRFADSGAMFRGMRDPLATSFARRICGKSGLGSL